MVQVALGHEVRDVHSTIKSARDQGIEIQEPDNSVSDTTAAAQSFPNSLQLESEARGLTRVKTVSSISE